MFPWMDAGGNLYFASNGHAGLGGLDIYKVQRTGADFGPVENMGTPINSPRDDFALIYRPADGIGFFTSNRPGGKGDDDLWAFKKLIPLVGFVRDADGNPMVDATVTVLTGRSAVRLPVDAEGKFVYGLGDRQTVKFVCKKAGFARQELEIKSSDLEREQENVRVVVLEKADQ